MEEYLNRPGKLKPSSKAEMRRHIELVADATIALGGCRLTSAGAEVDARVDERWRRILSAIGRDPADRPADVR